MEKALCVGLSGNHYSSMIGEKRADEGGERGGSPHDN